jgi:hypothetical protein
LRVPPPSAVMLSLKVIRSGASQIASLIHTDPGTFDNTYRGKYPSFFGPILETVSIAILRTRRGYAGHPSWHLLRGVNDRSEKKRNVISMKNDWKRIFTWENYSAHCDLRSFP